MAEQANQAATLEVKIVDGGTEQQPGAGGAPGQAGPQTGVPAGAMASGTPSENATGAPSPKVTGPASTTTYKPGMPPPPIQNGQAVTHSGGAPPISGLAVAATVATKSLQLMREAIELSTIMLRAESQARVHLIAGDDVQRAEVAQMRGQSEAWKRMPIIGPLIGAIKDRQIAEKETDLNELDASMNRAGRLGQYSSPISQSIARRSIAQRNREFAEAQSMGGPYSDLVNEKTRRETLNWAQSAIANQRMAADETKKLREENNRREKEYIKAIGRMPKAMADAFVKALRGGGDPFSDMLGRMRIPEDHRPRQDEELRRERDGGLTAPLLGG